MNKVLKMGNRLAVAALRKNLKCSDEKGLLHDTTERNRLEKQYMIDLMSKTLHLANEQVKDRIVYVGNPRKSISDILEQSQPNPIPITSSRSTLTVTLDNHSYV